MVMEIQGTLWRKEEAFHYKLSKEPLIWSEALKLLGNPEEAEEVVGLSLNGMRKC